MIGTSERLPLCNHVFVRKSAGHEKRYIASRSSKIQQDQVINKQDNIQEFSLNYGLFDLYSN